MKAVQDTTVAVCDYGYFISVAEKLAETCKRVLYYSPTDREYQKIEDHVFGVGVKNVERVHDILHPDVFDTVDWFVFPDIGFAALQNHLRSMSKPVWGSFNATELELYRTLFMQWVKELKLPYVESKVIHGLTKLSDHLKDVSNKWIKVDKYRGDMETWHHLDWDHSQRELENLAVVFGGAKEHIDFIVQDAIKTDIEVGYDGWTVDGRYPSMSYQGYEKKNELYLGSLRKFEELPAPVLEVNKAIAQTLKRFGYRNWMATEIRVADGKPYFTDPTFRMPGQTGEQMLETCSNLAEVMWKGAHGVLTEPEFKYKYALSASMHYDAGHADEWGVIKVPNEISRWVKPCHYGIIKGMYHFPPGQKLDLGVVLGVGNSLKEAFSHLRKNVDAMGSEPVSFHLDGFFDLLDSIRTAEKNGISFSDDPIPTDEEIMKFAV